MNESTEAEVRLFEYDELHPDWQRAIHACEAMLGASSVPWQKEGNERFLALPKGWYASNDVARFGGCMGQVIAATIAFGGVALLLAALPLIGRSDPRADSPLPMLVLSFVLLGSATLLLLRGRRLHRKLRTTAVGLFALPDVLLVHDVERYRVFPRGSVVGVRRSSYTDTNLGTTFVCLIKYRRRDEAGDTIEDEYSVQGYRALHRRLQAWFDDG